MLKRSGATRKQVRGETVRAMSLRTPTDREVRVYEALATSWEDRLSVIEAALDILEARIDSLKPGKHLDKAGANSLRKVRGSG